MQQINTIGRHNRKKYGQNVYKIPISISGFTCPNIDGTVAKGGCTFCQNDSFSPNLSKTDSPSFKLKPSSQTNPMLEKQIIQLKEQYNKTKIRLEKKFGATKFIIYFQSFTNTYAPIDTIKTLYKEAIKLDDVVGLSIGTRTDSITDEVLDFLVLLNKKIDITIEYGVQSIYDETLEKINRGHNFQNIKEWILKTKQKGLDVCAHIIFGLPDETIDMMKKTVDETIKLGVDSIKYHPLYVTKNTKLYLDYKADKFKPISEKDYIDMIIYAIKQHPKNLITQRITAGTYDVVAPIWCSDKQKQLNSLRQILYKNGFVY
ncbi:MAG: TIGR01212 family radical SAM protein [Campylobacteraceae bacterium 4484_166]|nr:MAG: TIGR01212 family radical SAM protein [Campylobacteraceae bacterium 4484_166]